jgi:hypothetical protein
MVIHDAEKPRKRRNPLTAYSKTGLNQAGKKTIKDRAGYMWVHVLTADEPEAKRLELFYKRAGKKPGLDYKIVKNGETYEVFIDARSDSFDNVGPKPWETRSKKHNKKGTDGSAWQHWEPPNRKKKE